MLPIFAALVAASTAVLILAGGFVTSTGSGLSVPDWPNTYGWFMWSFPINNMVGGILTVVVTGVYGVGATGHVCPVIFNDIANPSGSYSTIATPANSYSDITTPSQTYTTITDPSGSWSDVTPNSGSWTPVDDC